MKFVPDYLPVCNDCNNDINNQSGDDDTVYEELIIPRRHHEKTIKKTKYFCLYIQ